MKETKEERALDREISQAWARLAQGVQVNVMDIPNIVRDAKLEMAGDATMDEAIAMMVERYRVN